MFLLELLKLMSKDEAVDEKLFLKVFLPLFNWVSIWL